MISDNMKTLTAGNSVIRAMFEEGQKLKAIHGADKVYDFSLGNPYVAPPAQIKEAIGDILTNEPAMFVHGYMQNAGYEDVRSTIATSINKEFGVNFTAANIIMTVGAAGALNIVLKTIINPGDEIITFAPYFGEYNSYAKCYGGIIRAVEPDVRNFQPDLKRFEQAINEKTKAVIINSPNNPSGAVYTEDTIKKIAGILNRIKEESGRTIYIISDEPYRKLVYGGVKVPYIANCYPHTFTAYSYSKALSLPGERIGYLTVPDEMDGFAEIMEALVIANRVLGYVNAPSLFQRVVAKCVNSTVDVSFYERNMTDMYQALIDLGFTCFKPQGAFYLFPKALEEDDKAFCQKAKAHNILVVPGSSFGCPGFFRLAYCTSHDTIINSIESFKKLRLQYP